MMAEVFRTGEKFEDIVQFFEAKGFIRKTFGEAQNYLGGRRHVYFKISEDDLFLLLVEQSPDEDAKIYEKKLQSLFSKYMLLVCQEAGEYRFFKYDAGTGRILKLRKQKSDLELTFLRRLEALEYNNVDSFEELFDRSEFIKEFHQLCCDSEKFLLGKIGGVLDERDKEFLTKVIFQRIMFLWFIQKKRLLDNNENYFLDKFREISGRNGNFYQAFLRKLFFKGLCVRPSEREEEVARLIGDVPYLNGGLFIETEVELKYSISIPNEAFYKNMRYPISRGEQSIPTLNLLECKEWTVDERSGEVDKINPEILGYIFEKSVNKKDLGAVYTPEEVTTFIAKNTIYPYLVDCVNEEFYTHYGDLDELLRNGSGEHLRYLFQVLRDIKIVDTAVGSGHFLVDAIVTLEKIYHALRERGVLGWSNYQIREHIIVNSLFGVDILEEAVEICKLRLFLALAETFRTREDVQPLPNIDFNIRCGNSLIGFASTSELIQNFFPKGEAVKTILGHLDFLEKNFPEIAEKARNILSRPVIVPMDLFKLRNELVSRYRTLHDRDLQPKTRKVLIEITEAINKELNAQYYGTVRESFQSDENLKKLREDERYRKFLELKPFHWVLEYSEVFQEGGFDIVIGNPPYISNKNLKHNEKVLYNKLSHCTHKQYDIYVLFVERGMEILKDRGEFSYIISNKFLITEYGKPLRNLLLKEWNTKAVIDVSNIKVFKEAAAYPIIIHINKKRPSEKITIGTVDKLTNLHKPQDSPVPKKFFQSIPENIIPLKITKNNLPILVAVTRKFNNRYNFSCGIAITGFSKHITSKPQNPQDYQPIIQGDNIKPYAIISSNKYIKKSIIPPGKQGDFLKKKIVIPGMVKQLHAAIDLKGHALGRIYYLTEDIGITNLKSTLLLLNSKLFQYTYQVIYGSSHMAGGYLRINAPYLNIFSYPQNNKHLSTLTEYILTLQETSQENQYLQFLKELADCIIYELYLEEGLGTELTTRVTPHLHKLEKIPQEEKLNTIKETINKIKNDPQTKHEIEKIKNHPWIKIIESHT
ncbi:MAG: Eco57I restriction-modification methylase domain-containing protein [Candidatus Freyarchaeota archaeon]|nr:Eco57I restriction-modification methylase domain-containing protein [Candidatus Jordarchaeia archaeon]